MKLAAYKNVHKVQLIGQQLALPENNLGVNLRQPLSLFVIHYIKANF